MSRLCQVLWCARRCWRRYMGKLPKQRQFDSNCTQMGAIHHPQNTNIERKTTSIQTVHRCMPLNHPPKNIEGKTTSIQTVHTCPPFNQPLLPLVLLSNLDEAGCIRIGDPDGSDACKVAQAVVAAQAHRVCCVDAIPTWPELCGRTDVQLYSNPRFSNVTMVNARCECLRALQIV